MRAGTHRDLLIWPKSRCFAWKNHRWDLGPTETSDSGANHAILYAQDNRGCLGPIESCCSGPKVAVLPAKPTDGWDL